MTSMRLCNVANTTIPVCISTANAVDKHVRGIRKILCLAQSAESRAFPTPGLLPTVHVRLGAFLHLELLQCIRRPFPSQE